MVNQPCPDCGTLMERTVFAVETREGWRWRCPACSQHWTDQQIGEVYEMNSLEDDYRLYDLDEDGSYYDDDYGDDEPGYADGYYETYGWRYRLNRWRWIIYWFMKSWLTRCPTCKKRFRDCRCLPF